MLNIPHHINYKVLGYNQIFMLLLKLLKFLKILTYKIVNTGFPSSKIVHLKYLIYFYINKHITQSLIKNTQNFYILSEYFWLHDQTEEAPSFNRFQIQTNIAEK